MRRNSSPARPGAELKKSIQTELSTRIICGSGTVLPHGFQIALPDARSIMAKDALAALRAHEQLQSRVHDLALRLKAGQLARFADQTFFNYNVRPAHKHSIHQMARIWCMERQSGEGDDKKMEEKLKAPGARPAPGAPGSRH